MKLGDVYLRGNTMIILLFYGFIRIGKIKAFKESYRVINGNQNFNSFFYWKDELEGKSKC